MRPFANWLALAALAACLLMTWTGRRFAAQQRTHVAVTHLYTGPDGLTHAEDIEMKLLPTEVAATSPHAAPAENGEIIRVAGMQFKRRAPGFEVDWHTVSRKQYVITLSGRTEIELTGGQKILLVPGKVMLEEDLTGKGHIDRVTGTEDWTYVTIPLADK